VRLLFELPAPWTCDDSGRLRVWTRPDCGIRVEVDGPFELPADRKVWGERVLTRDLPAGGGVRQLELVNSENHHGWPLTMVTTHALDAAGDPVEARVTLFYELLYYGASLAAIVPKADADRWDTELRAPVLDAMLHAEPRFRGEPVANVAELWDMTPRE